MRWVAWPLLPYLQVCRAQLPFTQPGQNLLMGEGNVIVLSIVDLQLKVQGLQTWMISAPVHQRISASVDYIQEELELASQVSALMVHMWVQISIRKLWSSDLSRAHLFSTILGMRG